MMRRSCLLVLTAVALCGLSGCTTSVRWYVEQKVGRTLTASLRTHHVIVHWRPDSLSARHARRIAAAAEKEVALICARLGVANDTVFNAYVFDSADELARRTGVKGVGGFAVERSVFIVCDNETARLHELVHAVVGAKLRTRAPTFAGEGIANAFFDDVPGWDVHAVARYYHRERKLPTLEAMMDDFHALARKTPGFNSYDVAGSWMRFLLDTQGVEKTKQYLAGGNTERAFGRSLADLEQAWHAMLRDYRPRADVATQVALSAAVPVSSVTRFEGDPFHARLGFALESELKPQPDGTKTFSYSYSFAIDSAQGAAPSPSESIRYRWWKNGRIIPGATSPELQFASMSTGDSGVYMVVVSVRDGETRPRPVLARVVLLTVVPAAPQPAEESPTRSGSASAED